MFFDHLFDRSELIQDFFKKIISINSINFTLKNLRRNEGPNKDNILSSFSYVISHYNTIIGYQFKSIKEDSTYLFKDKLPGNQSRLFRILFTKNHII